VTVVLLADDDFVLRVRRRAASAPRREVPANVTTLSSPCQRDRIGSGSRAAADKETPLISSLLTGVGRGLAGPSLFCGGWDFFESIIDL
jgi:hypothetical protein